MPKATKKVVKKVKVKEIPDLHAEAIPQGSDGSAELEQLRFLYQQMKDLGFNSIGDIENKIARLQK